MLICEILKETLEERNIKQKNLAQALGIKETTLSNKLNQKRKLYADEFRDICMALCLDANEIITRAAKKG